MKKRINAAFYTEERFGREWRENLDEDNPRLYSNGMYWTRITAEDLPED